MTAPENSAPVPPSDGALANSARTKFGTESFGTDPGDAARARSIGGPSDTLSEDQVDAFIAEVLGDEDFDDKSVCLVIPDRTRTCPMPQLMRAVHSALHGRVRELTAVVALGTHQGHSDADLADWLGYEVGRIEETYPGLTVHNHEHWDPQTFTDLGEISAERILELSGGRLPDTPVDVKLNKQVAGADIALVIGPVFPHEVVGFSGGNKYFYPGVASSEVIDVSHWLGALITTQDIIGVRGITPVRALINEASTLIPARRLALTFVVVSNESILHTMAFGTPEDAWAWSSSVAAETHVKYLDAPVQRVLSIMPTKYEDIWTAAKGFYKLDPIVADGGEVIIYAPHITELAVMHPELAEVGYHTRDYFVGQWDRFKDQHWGVLAHSTHLRGRGTWSEAEGERGRVTVTLATGIPREIVESINLRYLDPAEVDIAAYEADPDTFVEPHAGEVLYRLR